MIDHLSYTQINMYLRCPRQYYFRYCENLILPPKTAMLQGRCVHKAQEHGFKKKLEAGRGYKTEECAEVFADEWSKALEEYEPIFEEDETKYSVLDQGVALVRHYGKVVGRYIKPAMVEQEFRLSPWESGPHLVGYIDLVTSQKDLVDLKVSSRLPNADAIHKDLQLSVYGMGFSALTDSLPRSYRWHMLIRTKVPRVAILKTTRDESDFRVFENTAEEVAKGIGAQVFPRRTDGWHCSEKFCGYWPRCMRR